MQVRWTRPAVEQLSAIGEFIAENNPAAARDTERRLREAVAILARFPAMGRLGRIPHTRELVVPGTPYVVPYRVEGNFIDILAIFHGAQDR